MILTPHINNINLCDAGRTFIHNYLEITKDVSKEIEKRTTTTITNPNCE